MKRTKTATPPRGINKDPEFKSEYKGVGRYTHPQHGFVWYSARVGVDYESWHDTEIDAAKAVDKVRICRGLEPVNVFKRKTSDLRDSDPKVV